MARVLVIDDDVELLEMLRIALEQRGGHQTTLTADGEDGIAAAVADPPDLAIVDVMMPGINGYEVCRRLRANPATSSVPILILTARGQPVDREAALDAGADEYMAKPVTVSALLEGIDGLLAKASAAELPLLTGSIVLLSLRGGVGVTTLAVNLGATLTRAADGAACVVDLCPSSGHVALQLGLRPQPNWSGLVRAGNLDAEAVEAHLLEHGSGLHVLASPVIPAVGQAMPRAAVQTVLETLRKRFPVIIVDAPSILNGATMAALEAATALGLVVTAEYSSIQTTIATLRVLQRWSSRSHIILNQVTPRAQWPAEAIGRVLGRAPIGRVPFDPGQADALKQGKPLAVHRPGAPLAEAVRSIARELAQAAGSTSA